MRREINHALVLEKGIVPLLVDGFRLSEDGLPLELRELAAMNAIKILPDFYTEAMNRLVSRFLKAEKP